MIQFTRSGATWGDVFVHSTGVIGCAFDSNSDVIVEYHDVNGAEVRGQTIFRFAERVLFVRAESLNGQVVVMGQGNQTGRFLIQGLSDPFLDTYGTHPCDVLSSSRYVVQISKGTYYDSSYGVTTIPEIIYGTSNGIIQLHENGTVKWADLTRATVPEMFYPFYQNDAYIGEGRTDPPHIQALEGGAQKNIYEGIAERPRCAYDSLSNTFAIASRSSAGVLFQFSPRPLTSIDVVPPIEPPIPPVDPPVPPDTGNGGSMNESYDPIVIEDPELQQLADRLEKKYQSPAEQGGLARGATDTFVDELGASRWRRDYFVARDKGKSADAAWHEVNTKINQIVGLPGNIDPNFP